ncbi:HelD family protein [Cohnella sp. JJ-181]|uniref:HelD family protein n=1 Tax=Cohnella rhizoplanae TaxID=2974897 RepID=UPI0022FFA3CB|nr:ATP-binding domain-containing protein [Cohnella sp. JJ-181]CAI6085093.1 DNA helicase IV [Cohnella sp. JJ-181]
MSEDKRFREETVKLERTKEEIRGQISGIGPRYAGNDYTEQTLDAIRQERKERLAASEKEPYFGRLDFREEGRSEPLPLYIGKTGVGEGDGHRVLVVDWRAPVSSLFYAFSGGAPEVAYEAPEGPVAGTVHLKRNLLVREGELQRVVDSYAEGGEQGGSAGDEFLLHKLGESKDNKLRDIVSTIQQEQDLIIRTEKNKAVFIQGVAGSGKTTVALHRLAYLLYRYQDRVRAERMMILAPSKMFLNYISGVLPELGVGDIAQQTFEDWAIERIGEDLRMKEPADELAHWFENAGGAVSRADAPAKLKGSLGFLAEIDEALGALERSLIPDEPFSPDDRRMLPAEQIRAWFAEENPLDPLMKKRERLLNRLKRWMEIELGKARWSDAEVRKKANARWKAYAAKLPLHTASSFYIAGGWHAAGGNGDAVSGSGAPAPAQGKSKGKAKGKAAVLFGREDLAALVHIHLRLHGSTVPAYDHIVIDEAQDYAPAQLQVLRQHQRITSMTVLGDLQQGIHDYAGITVWEELRGLFPADETSYYELDRSYRSTLEIIEFANRILRGMGGGVKPARPVFRSGQPVEVERTSHAPGAGAIASIASIVESWREEPELQSIAVLGRTAAACARIHAELTARGIRASLLEAKHQNYEGGVTVAPVYLSKGLEFDAVLIPDADEAQYAAADAKLLYVGCTRALHRLKLLYAEAPTPLILTADVAAEEADR